ncbi:1653_t:CDS:2 [Ambispora gerdemannii]|uniref:1653_t:CDS:1 n=1 Tax=Ambispora gerdemannii TaxID=144530 RepID=A0A9N9B8V6_9GLOM|nr:1653_t:CDS:2 [Ambispora gerdemannii]
MSQDEQIQRPNLSEDSQIKGNSYQGAGKSTLGNLLLDQKHDEGSFNVSANMESCTQVCGESEVTIDGQKFNIVDTPGIFDTNKPDAEVFKEIARTVHKCAYGLKAILFVFEAKRFTEEQKNVLDGIKIFLGEDAMNYMIAIFSHATKKQNENKDEMRKAWNSLISSFIKNIGNRWGISPDSDYFPPEHEKDYQETVDKIKKEFEQKEFKELRKHMAEMEAKLTKMESDKSNLENQVEEMKRKKTDCFALDTKVQLASGKLLEMAELQVGDLVLCNVRNNLVEFSEIYLISHLGHYDYPLNMVKIEFTNSDGSKGYIRTTSTHCIFSSDLSILYAQDVVPGKTKILVLDEANELIPVTVDNRVMEKDTGYISFYTHAGTVIANNILCSCYDDCPLSQLLMDLAFAPIRLWTKVFPSTHRQKELHPYVQILETAYVTWCKTLEGVKMI